MLKTTWSYRMHSLKCKFLQGLLLAHQRSVHNKIVYMDLTFIMTRDSNYDRTTLVGWRFFAINLQWNVICYIINRGGNIVECNINIMIQVHYMEKFEVILDRNILKQVLVNVGNNFETSLKYCIILLTYINNTDLQVILFWTAQNHSRNNFLL